MNGDSAKDSEQTAPRVPSRSRRIALLTAGGDAPGMNAAIRAVIRAADTSRIDVMGARRGYEGLIDDQFESLTSRSVANIIARGGTILETSRSDEFRRQAGRERAMRNLRERGIEAMVVIGGEGALAGAAVFQRESGMTVMALPASIDNDVPGTDYAIGFDTAVNTALESIDRIRDTAFAFERVFCVEVMGRDSGFIALAVALAAGAEVVVVPEIPLDMDDVVRRVEGGIGRGKRSSIIVVSEGPRTGGVMPLANELQNRLGIQPRIVVLGHVQRGGAPTARDRISACRMGVDAVEAIIEGVPSSLIGEERGTIVRVPLDRVHEHARHIDSSLIEMVHRLAV
jgi:6-phosphofructokinase 1